jgi:hypothetical protein
MRIAFVTRASPPDIEDETGRLAEALAHRGALVLTVAWE